MKKCEDSVLKSQTARTLSKTQQSIAKRLHGDAPRSNVVVVIHANAEPGKCQVSVSQDVWHACVKGERYGKVGLRGLQKNAANTEDPCWELALLPSLKSPPPSWIKMQHGYTNTSNQPGTLDDLTILELHWISGQLANTELWPLQVSQALHLVKGNGGNTIRKRLVGPQCPPHTHSPLNPCWAQVCECRS